MKDGAVRLVLGDNKLVAGVIGVVGGLIRFEVDTTWLELVGFLLDFGIFFGEAFEVVGGLGLVGSSDKTGEGLTSVLIVCFFSLSSSCQG